MKKFALIKVIDGEFSVSYEETCELAERKIAELAEHVRQTHDVLYEYMQGNSVCFYFENNTKGCVCVKPVDADKSILLWDEDSNEVTTQTNYTQKDMQRDFDYYVRTLINKEKKNDWSVYGMDRKDTMHGFFAVTETNLA